MLKTITCLEDGRTYSFQARTPYEAMEALLYTLNLRSKDANAKIRMTKSGLHLYVNHSNKTYSIAV